MVKKTTRDAEPAQANGAGNGSSVPKVRCSDLPTGLFFQSPEVRGQGVPPGMLKHRTDCSGSGLRSARAYTYSRTNPVVLSSR